MHYVLTAFGKPRVIRVSNPSAMSGTFVCTNTLHFLAGNTPFYCYLNCKALYQKRKDYSTYSVDFVVVVVVVVVKNRLRLQEFFYTMGLSIWLEISSIG